MKRTRLVMVGACAIDHILTVPHFPEEDSKLRATAFTKRRGGNCPNSIEVFQQLISLDHQAEGSRSTSVETSLKSENLAVELFLIATLPRRECDQTRFIVKSFDSCHSSNESEHDTLKPSLSSSPLLDYCIYRDTHSEPITSYIFASQATSSRTIINNNALPEMTFDEFVSLANDLLQLLTSSTTDKGEQIWFHFEGRIPNVTLQCIRYLRNHQMFTPGASSQVHFKVSVELEKPGREGLQELAHEADVVFYSKAWAEGQGYESAEICLIDQSKILRISGAGSQGDEPLLICTWGADGAYAMLRCHSGNTEPNLQLEELEPLIVHRPAYTSDERPIVDTTGAGDTFIAGMIFGLICRAAGRGGSSQTKPRWTLGDDLDFANGLAGRKILQNGFSGLGYSSLALRGEIDSRSSRSD